VRQGSRLLPPIAGFVAAGAAGGAAALGAVAAAGGLGSTTTVKEVQQAPPPGQVVLGRGGRDDALTIGELYERAAPGVVQISAGRRLGSGFVIDKAGHIVTNYRTVRGAQHVEVSFSDADRMRAKIVGTDPATDLAVLQVALRSRALEPLALGDSDHVRVGDPVVAVGNPLGYARTATFGIVSAVQRVLRPAKGAAVDRAIQTDAVLDEGSSGGPLLNAAGQVIGVNAGAGDTHFAVPVNTVKQVAAQLIAGERAEEAYLGVESDPLDAQLARIFNLPTRRGLLVERVEPHSPAAAAGLRGGSTPTVVSGESYLLGGDVIVEADGTPVTTDEALRDVLAGKRPGDRLSLEVLRGAKEVTLTATLQARTAAIVPS
jgi:S1-C subfamily serine protease